MHFIYFSPLKIRPRIQICIRIRIRIRYQNPGSGSRSARNGCGSETLPPSFSYLLKLLKKVHAFFYFFTLKNQALYPDPDPHSLSKPWIWIQIREKWMRIRNPARKVR